MNIVLFQERELLYPFPRCDRRIQHILSVLKKQQGDSFRAGIINTSTGHAVITQITTTEVTVTYVPESKPIPLIPITLLLGFPRPIQAKRIFKDCASMGISNIILTGTELGEKSYRESTFFKHDEFYESLLEGAEQAGNPCIPSVFKYWSLHKALSSISQQICSTQKIVLHPNEQTDLDSTGSSNLGQLPLEHQNPVILAIGSERGWTEDELALLLEANFKPASLGTRILRTETACTAALAIVAAKLGYL